MTKSPLLLYLSPWWPSYKENLEPLGHKELNFTKWISLEAHQLTYLTEDNTPTHLEEYIKGIGRQHDIL